MGGEETGILTRRVKKSRLKRKLSMGCLLMAAIFMFPFVLVIAMFGGMMTAASESLVAEYVTASGLIGASWQEILAFDTVRYENDMDNVNPYISAMEFTVVEYKRYEKVITEDGTVILVLVESLVFRKAAAIRSFFRLPDSSGIDDVLAEIDIYPQTDPYVIVFNVYSKSIDTVMEEHSFDFEQEEWMGMLIIEGMLTEMFGGDSPDFIAESGTGMFAWPLPGIPESNATSSYGNRFHPVDNVWKFHYGTDIGCPVGTPVIAVGDGVVKSAGVNGGSAGIFVTITHEINGNLWTTKYFHLSQIKVGVGEKVGRGTVVALSGNTGKTTGPHLHIETICNGAYQNPLPLITRGH